ncbi:creatininase, partial [Lactobacillus crispatus]
MDTSRRRVWWDEYASREFRDCDPQATIAILPIAAIEQHGPHLPVGVDAAVNRGMLAALIDRLPGDLDIRILPVQEVGKSNEHLRMPGTLTLPAATLIEAWTELGLSVARAGLRKLVIVNSHGGNDEVMGIV